MSARRSLCSSVASCAGETFLVCKDDGSGYTATSCDDGDPLTDDSCAPATGCTHTQQPQSGPCVEALPSSLDFGSLTRGESKSEEVTIHNCSAESAAKISDIVGGGPVPFQGLPKAFSFAPATALPVTLAPDESLNVTVTYTPGLSGPSNGTLTAHFDQSVAALRSLSIDIAGMGVAPPASEIGLHVELTWDADHSDVDLHVVAPEGKLFDCKTDCYYANPTPDWGTQGDLADDPFLDMNNVDGYGPEVANIDAPAPGTYTVAAHYYSDTGNGDAGSGVPGTNPTKATVKIVSHGNVLATFGPQLLEQTDSLWKVCTIEWKGAGQAPVVTELGTTTTYTGDTGGSCIFSH